MSGADEFAGLLRERVTLSRRSPARDAAGGATGGWIDSATLWASVSPARADFGEVGEAADPRPRWTVLLRYTDVDPGDRINWGDRRLRVRAVIFDPRVADRLTLDCEEER